MKEEKKNVFSYQGEAGSSAVVYPLLLNYGLSAVGVDSFNCPVELRGEPWLPSPIAAQLVRVRLFYFNVTSCNISSFPLYSTLFQFVLSICLQCLNF
jgi:hypothetical protein